MPIPAHVRDDFPILQQKTHGRPLVYLDSAATTQKPVQVIEAMNDYYRQFNANVHRGAYELSVEATSMYEGARAKVASFINAAHAGEVVFTRGTTTSINFLAYGWGLNRFRPGDRILLTEMEHHANIVPWQLVAKHTGAELVYLPLTGDFLVDLSRIDEVLDERVKLVGISGMSNVLGTIGPVAEVAAAAHEAGALVVVDGAQSVPHLPTDVQALGIDFLAFGAHKMLGPTGIGVLWGRSELLDAMEPAEGGGEMIKDVGLYESSWASVPHKFEAGTPPIAEAIGFGAAIDYLAGIGMDEVRAHELDIVSYALAALAEVPGLTVYGPSDPALRGGAVAFSLDGIHPHDIATILDESGVAVRAGHHCARPLHRCLGIPATARASFFVYTIREEIDALVAALHNARRIFGVD